MFFLSYVSGFSLILNIEADEYLPNPMEGSGAVIAVHPQSDRPDVDKIALMVAPGTLNTITLSTVSYP